MTRTVIFKENVFLFLNLIVLKAQRTQDKNDYIISNICPLFYFKSRRHVLFLNPGMKPG